MLAGTQHFEKRLKALNARFVEASIGKESLLKIISETEIAEQVYNSNAIENSTLTLEETDKILQQIDLDRYISQRELFEAKNLARVVEYTNQKATERELTLELILDLHKMLISNIQNDIAGRFREKNEWVRVGQYIAPDPAKVIGLLNKMLITYRISEGNLAQKIARFHLDFEHTHPFVDGNGRIGRVLINYALIRSGHVPINIKFIDRALYYEAFRDFDAAGSTDIMEGIVNKALSNSYHKRLAYLEGKEIITLSQYAKNAKTTHSNLLNKANRQTIEAFWDRGVWKIGV